MSELLTSIGTMISAFIKIFIRGLVNFDSPVLSIIDYALWGPVIIGFAAKLLKRK